MLCIAPLTTLQKSTNNSYHILEICHINIPHIQIEELKQIHKSTNNGYHILEICHINIPHIQIEELKQIHNVFIDINK